MDNCIRRILLRQQRIYVGFRAISAKDYIVVARCNKCGDLDHVFKYCTREEVCQHCGAQDHKKETCPNGKQPAACIPCKRRGKKCTDNKQDCPTHKLLIERLIQKTDYE